MILTVPADVGRAATVEIRKITTLRAGWALLPACAGIGFVAAAVTAITGTPPQEDEVLATGTASIGLYLSVAVALAVAGVFAALGSGAEYRYRSIALSSLCTPDRDLLCGAKIAVAAVYSLLLAAAAEVGAAIGLLAFGRHKIEFGLRLVEVFAGGLLAPLCWGVIGASLGLLLRSAVLAIAAMAGWLVVAEPLLWLVLRGAGIPGFAAVLPGSATVGTVAVDSFPKSPFLPPSAASVVVLVVWAAAAGGAAWWYLRQREI
ncbi:hypothetical protein [Nocardia sp. BMG51109]|uniref:hypothetical protein n=1 Tax=Nocardia sp. BMG51109 TaxID=1056816 RepID=UPI0004645474|nr:hypothetical protein [Nocardia sp. BMG51109]